MRTLRNAIGQDAVHHAYLFVGSRGTGKTSMAKMLAACLNCVDGPTVEPCGVCESCVSIASATSMDVIEMDAASNNSVDDIRELRDSVQYAPVTGRYKVYIFDEAHMLSSAAWNAFLKTLEEPPPSTIFVLATTEAHKIMDTVVDRCHRFDFRRPTVEQLATVVQRVAGKESIEIAPEAVALVARNATGSYRDALGTLEQLVTYSGAAIATEDVLAVLGVADDDLLFGALDAIAAHDARAALAGRRAAGRLRPRARAVPADLETHARDVLVVQTLGEVPPQLAITRRARRAAGRPGRAACRARTRSGCSTCSPRPCALAKDGADAADAAGGRAGQGGRAGGRPVDARAAGADGADGGGAARRGAGGRRARLRRCACRRRPRRRPRAAPSGRRRARARAADRRRRRPRARAAPPRPTAPPASRRRASRAPEPEPTAVAVAEPPAPIGELDLAMVQELWPAVLQNLAESNQLLGRLPGRGAADRRLRPRDHAGVHARLRLSEEEGRGRGRAPAADRRVPGADRRRAAAGARDPRGRGAGRRARGPRRGRLHRPVAGRIRCRRSPARPGRPGAGLMPQPNIQNMLKQAQEAMAAQQEAQEALKEQKVEASAGGGMVKVVVSGDLSWSR